MSVRTLSLIGVLAIVTIVLLVLAFLPSRKAPTPQETVVQITPVVRPTAPAETVLSLSPSTLTVSPGASQSSVMVTINSGNNSVTAVQLDMTFDPKAIANVTVTQPASSFFQNGTVLLNNVNQTNGTISYAVAAPLTGASPKGTGNVATISFRPLLTTGSTTISFTPKTLVTTEGSDSSVLKSTQNATITVSGQ